MFSWVLNKIPMHSQRKIVTLNWGIFIVYFVIIIIIIIIIINHDKLWLTLLKSAQYTFV